MVAAQVANADDVTVILPMSLDDAHRLRLARYVIESINRQGFRNVRVSSLPRGSAWCKARAVAEALPTVRTRLLVVHDADCLVPLSGAVGAVQTGNEAWAMPHTNVRRLTASATESVLSQRQGSPVLGLLALAEREYRGVAGGGVVVLPTDTYRRVPLDPRFVGWGQEDVSWSKALSSLAGWGWRGHEPLYHLWHEPQPRQSRRIGSDHSYTLAERYRKAALSGPAAVAALVAEIPA